MSYPRSPRDFPGTDAATDPGTVPDTDPARTPADNYNGTHTAQSQSNDRFAGIDERFTFNYLVYDNLDEDQRWSRWDDLEALCKGPEPRPEWVVTSSGAIDTELGILKTGKEADVYLIEREDPHDPDSAVVMAAKRYRPNRALAKRRAWVQASEDNKLAVKEWDRLRTCWQIGLPTPYPVQIDGHEILMEWIHHDGDTAPRLAQTRPSPELLEDLYEQFRAAMVRMVQAGWVHGDLSPYNTLLAGERLVIIDVPQMIDLVSSGFGPDTLLRDCVNMCNWFGTKGLRTDAHELFAELMAGAF